MPNHTVKNGLKAKRIKLPQISFFSRKTTNKILMYLFAPSILQKSKKILRADPDLRGCAIFGPIMPYLSWTKFFGTNHYYYFHLHIGLFHWGKFEKILTADPELWGCAISGPKMVHLPQTTFFFGKLLISFSSTY